MLLKRSFVIHLCCLKYIAISRNTKIGDPEWHLLNYETNKKNNNTKHGLHFRTAEQAKRKEKEREKLPDSKNRKNATNQEFSFFVTHVFVQFIRRLRRHRRKFFFQKNIHKKTFFVPEKDFKILRLRSDKRKKKNLWQVKQSF